MCNLPRNGITPPLVTPLAAPDQLDVDGFARISERAIEAGVQGLFVLGTTGEGPSLSQTLKREVISHCCAVAKGRVPVLAGLLEASTDDALRLAEFAAEAGAAALVLTPPFYFPLPQSAVIQYAERLIPRLPLPVYLYNIPVFTKVPLEPETLAHLAKLPNVRGIKDSGGDLKKLARSRALCPDTPILWGPEEVLLEAMEAGADGGVNGGANLFPKLYVALYNSIRKGEALRAKTLQDVAARINREIYGAAQGGPGFVFGIKCALEALGLASSLPAEPLTLPDEATRARIRAATIGIELLVTELIVTP
ncbi:MAG: dihydrodipicolinate synthase family protein [Acidobacteria bacterium]|nr:dihydrodipicolinate synthase family protein [Acidobacteriota bacterium]